MHEITREVAALLSPERVYSRQQVLARPSPVPARGGVYGWWFRRVPALVDASGCHQQHGLTLLYVGISPNRPPGNGRAPSRQNLRHRLRTHYAGNAEGSTLRKTLGCLLAEELGLELRRVGSRRRRTFVYGEQRLSAWMEQYAFTTWLVREQPWELEDALLAAIDLPLNLEGNRRNRFHQTLTQARARCVANADAPPVLPNPGVGWRNSSVEIRTDGPAPSDWRAPSATGATDGRGSSAGHHSGHNPPVA